MLFVFGVLSFASCPLQLLARAGAVKSADQAFDGRWWLSTNSMERLGYLYGLDDCLTYDAKPSLLFNDTWIDYEGRITAFYTAKATNLSLSVFTVYRRFGKSETGLAPKSARYGNEFWRAHSELARRGFLEGYLSCRSRYDKMPRWSKSVGYYLRSLDNMYNVDDRNGEKAPEYAGSVASALEKLKD